MREALQIPREDVTPANHGIAIESQELNCAATDDCPNELPQRTHRRRFKEREESPFASDGVEAAMEAVDVQLTRRKDGDHGDTLSMD
ncbi:MAG: hypothetical protein WD801_16895 [Gemmatimonadaceae bacterium]